LTVAARRLEEFARGRLALPGLAVALIGPGGWRHGFGLGVADAASGRAMEAGALLPIASIGKTMTAAALLRQQEAGHLDLDAPVGEYLPWLPLPTPFGPISVAHLLAHTAGIVSGMEGSPSPVAEALALGRTAPGWPPGARARYSNVGYSVLGLVLERVAGCSYAEAIQRHVLDPCAMAASEPVTTAEAQARAATGHLELAGGTLVAAPWVPTTAGSGATLCTAAGATLCTAADLGRFLGAVVAGDPPLLEPASREAMLTPALPLPEGPGYGYGLGVEIDTEAGYRRVGHQGDCPGFSGYAYGCPETGVGVVALGNGPWRPPGPAGTWAVVEHGLALLRAAALGLELPPRPTARRRRPAPRRPAAGRGHRGAPRRAGRAGRDLCRLEPVGAAGPGPARPRRRRPGAGAPGRRRGAAGPPRRRRLPPRRRPGQPGAGRVHHHGRGPPHARGRVRLALRPPRLIFARAGGRDPAVLAG
jgi:CubicO group peptidase (beta-lactamase class C family)